MTAPFSGHPPHNWKTMIKSFDTHTHTHTCTRQSTTKMRSPALIQMTRLTITKRMVILLQRQKKLLYVCQLPIRSGLITATFWQRRRDVRIHNPLFFQRLYTRRQEDIMALKEEKGGGVCWMDAGMSAGEVSSLSRSGVRLASMRFFRLLMYKQWGV